jgi:hypothetical protein
MKEQLVENIVLFVIAFIVALHLSLDDIKDYRRDTKINSKPTACKAKVVRVKKNIELVRKEGYGKAKVYDVVGYKIIYEFKVKEARHTGYFDIGKNQKDLYKKDDMVDVLYYGDSPDENSEVRFVDKNKNFTETACGFIYNFIMVLLATFIINYRRKR